MNKNQIIKSKSLKIYASNKLPSNLNQYLNKKQILNIPKLMINDKKNDDDKIFKWYSGIGHKDLLPSNNVSRLLKDFKIK